MINEKKEAIVPYSVKAQENDSEFNPANKKLPSVLDFIGFSVNLISLIKDNANDYLLLPPKKRIKVLINRIHYVKMIKTIVNSNYPLSFLENQLEFEEKSLKEDLCNGSGIYHLYTPETIFENMTFNKMPIRTRMIDFGHRIGFVVYNLKNYHGDHHFDFDTVILARWVCALFVQSNGEPLSEKSMQEYIAEGRKMKFSDFERDLF